MFKGTRYSKRWIDFPFDGSLRLILNRSSHFWGSLMMFGSRFINAATKRMFLRYFGLDKSERLSFPRTVFEIDNEAVKSFCEFHPMLLSGRHSDWFELRTTGCQFNKQSSSLLIVGSGINENNVRGMKSRTSDKIIAAKNGAWPFLQVLEC